MTQQSDLNILCPIHLDKLSELRGILDGIASNLKANRVLPFEKLNTTHFARWVIIEAGVDLQGNPLPPKLLLALDFDGHRDNYLNTFINVCQAELLLIYACCVNFPKDAAKNHQAFVSYLCDHHVPTSAGYCGHPKRSVVDIHQEEHLRVALSDYMDVKQHSYSWKERSVEFIRQDLQKFIMEKPKFHWVFQSQNRDFPGFWRWVPEMIIGILFLFLTVLGLWKIAGVAVVLFLLVWVILEVKFEVPSPFVDMDPGICGFHAQEDLITQNQMTSVTYVKPGFFYQVSLRLVLWLVNTLARFKFVDGNLDGISTIHFARWILVDQGRRLLFISNYDGSWQNYLGDFIDRAALGLSAIWGHTAGFPKFGQKGLGGAWNAQAFKTYARASQIPTQVWYSAYKSLSVENINQNSLRRKGFQVKMGSREIELWLSLF